VIEVGLWPVPISRLCARWDRTAYYADFARDFDPRPGVCKKQIRVLIKPIAYQGASNDAPIAVSNTLTTGRTALNAMNQHGRSARASTLPIVIILALFAILDAPASKADESPLACGFGKIPDMVEVIRGIECTVNARVTVVRAVLNGGECTDPIVYMSQANRYRKNLGSPDFAAYKDFRRTYIAGEKFKIGVPENCDLYSYTIVTQGADLTWQVK
jgi:hypothetical protein